MTVNDGYVLQDSDYPAVPPKTGYSGEWEKHTAAIHTNVTVLAEYTEVATHTVTFVADDTTVKTMTVNDGYVLQDSDYPAVPAKTGYSGEWEKYTAAIHTNITVLVEYTEVATHTVTFVADGTTVKTMTVNDGYRLQLSDYPTVPFKPGYIGSWNRYTAAIHTDITITATYTRDNGGGGEIPVPTTRPPIIASEGEEPIEADAEPIEADTELSEPVTPIETAAASEHEGQHLVTHTVQHDYVTQSGKVVRETVTTDGTVTTVMDFIYDASCRPFALLHYANGAAEPETYYYLLNLQGDVVALMNSSGSIIAKYTYSAWGELRTVTNASGTAITSETHIAHLNPLRYRGYYYDSETGFYYLQSRYYDPVTHRFINADGTPDTGIGFAGTNMFAYCNNSPVLFEDDSGYSLKPTTVAMNDSTSGNRHVGTTNSADLIAMNEYNNACHNAVKNAIDYVTNDDEEVVLEAEYIAFYKGVPYLKIDAMDDNAFSFGIVIMGNNVNATTVQHEYGHAVHASIIGLERYFRMAAVPSMIDYWSEVKYEVYFSEPQEYVADVLGGTNRTLYDKPYPYSISTMEAVAYMIITLIFP